MHLQRPCDHWPLQPPSFSTPPLPLPPLQLQPNAGKDAVAEHKAERIPGALFFGEFLELRLLQLLEQCCSGATPLWRRSSSQRADI